VIIEKQLKSVLGIAGYLILKRIIRGKQIAIVGNHLVIYQDHKEPITIQLSDIVEYINDH